MKTLKIGKKEIIVTDIEEMDDIRWCVICMMADLEAQRTFLEYLKVRKGVKDDAFLGTEIDLRIEYLKEAYQNGETILQTIREL